MAQGPPGALLAEWVPGVAALVASGFGYLDLLTAVDRPEEGEIEVVIHLVGSDGAGCFAHIRLDREAPSLDSLVGILPAANWHEREIAEMFGVDFVGHPDPTPLLLADISVETPLRKDVVLAARVERPWPGAKPEPGRRSRRPQLPHGVPDSELADRSARPGGE